MPSSCSWVKYQRSSVQADFLTPQTRCPPIHLRIVDHHGTRKPNADNWKRLLKTHFRGANQSINAESGRRGPVKRFGSCIRGYEFRNIKPIVLLHRKRTYGNRIKGFHEQHVRAHSRILDSAILVLGRFHAITSNRFTLQAPSCEQFL